MFILIYQVHFVLKSGSLLIFSGWDGDMAAILLLVYLLPPSGKKGTAKISIWEALDRVVKFHNVSVF